MIPKFLIQIYNNFHNFNNRNYNDHTNSSVKNTNVKLPYKYKTFGKNASYILLRLYKHPSNKIKMSYDEGDASGTHLYNDELALQYLGLVETKNNLYQLTPKGINFVNYMLVNRLSKSISSKISIKVFTKMYNGGLFILNASWFILFCIVLIPSLLMLHAPRQIAMIGSNLTMISFLLLIILDAIISFSFDRYQFTYVDLLDFFKNKKDGDIYVHRDARQAVESNEEFDSECDDEEYGYWE